MKLMDHLLWEFEQAFDGCTSITTIQIPESIQIIDSQAFLGCSELEKVILITKILL